MRIRVFFPMAVLVLAGCFRLSDGVICTLQFVYGVNVTVTDENGEPVSGATLTLTEGAYSETMMELGDFQPGVYVGAGERAGTYTLTVDADGFETAVIEDIVVDADICHVIPVTREVSLAAR